MQNLKNKQYAAKRYYKRHHHFLSSDITLSLATVHKSKEGFLMTNMTTCKTFRGNSKAYHVHEHKHIAKKMQVSYSLNNRSKPIPIKTSTRFGA